MSAGAPALIGCNRGRWQLSQAAAREADRVGETAEDSQRAAGSFHDWGCAICFLAGHKCCEYTSIEDALRRSIKWSEIYAGEKAFLQFSKELAQGDVKQADAAADGRGERSLDGDAQVAAAATGSSGRQGLPLMRYFRLLRIFKVDKLCVFDPCERGAPTHCGGTHIAHGRPGHPPGNETA